ncbi:MAG: DUF2007 domain-containing protein [Thermoleophilia bacterium]|nr:DUF2007 domain-containing protein [Thermoleophilia bacterium]
MSGDPDSVVVAAPPDSFSGSIVAAALKSAGIPVEVHGDGQSGRLSPGALGRFGAVQVLVPRAFDEEALAILAELDAED